eukprot:scaffold50763_cov70-Phaeocystis_antarctica.AAC.1
MPRTAPTRLQPCRGSASAARQTPPRPCPRRPPAAVAGCSQPGRQHSGTARARRGTRWPPRSWPGRRFPWPKQPRRKRLQRAARRHACTPSIKPLSPRPAACSTPTGRTSAASAAASATSPPSHTTTVVAPLDRPTARSDASRPCPPRATKPLRDVSTSRAAPRAASSAAPRSPRPPRPPVTSHAPAATPPDAAAASTPRRRSRV